MGLCGLTQRHATNANPFSWNIVPPDSSSAVAQAAKEQTATVKNTKPTTPTAPKPGARPENPTAQTTATPQ